LSGRHRLGFYCIAVSHNHAGPFPYYYAGRAPVAQATKGLILMPKVT
jgi:hypothetical protein